MNKRQRKKKMKKCIPIIADEINLLMMTDEEQKQAVQDYVKYIEKYTYRKKYKDLKNVKPLFYFFPVGKSGNDYLQTMFKRCRKGSAVTVTHSNDQLTKELWNLPQEQ